MSKASARLNLAKILWGWVPHQTQREWMLNEAPVKVAACGRRWGKTESAAVDAAAMAVNEGDSVQMIVSPTYDQSRLIFDQVERLLMGSFYTRSKVKVVRTPYPKLTMEKAVIMARTADEDGRNLRGHSADRVIVDEAAYVRECVISEVISPMLADKNGSLVMVSTPFGKNHFYRAVMKGRPGFGSPTSGSPGSGGQESGSLEGRGSGRWASFTFPSWANPHISREYIEEQRNEISARQFAVEYEAEFVDDQSCVFSWEDISMAVERNFVRESEACVVVGIDWARYSDYTALVAVAVGEAGCEVVGIDRFNGIGWQSQMERVVDFLIRYRAVAALTDRTSIGDPLLEQLKTRLWEKGLDVAVDGYGFTNQSKRDLIEHLALKFAHNSISIPRDEALMRELQYFEYELTSSGNVKLNARQGFHDDLVIALALACRQAKDMGFAGRYLGGGSRIAACGW